MTDGIYSKKSTIIVFLYDEYLLILFLGVSIVEGDARAITMELELQWDGNPSIILDIVTRVGVRLPIQVISEILIMLVLVIVIVWFEFLGFTGILNL